MANRYDLTKKKIAILSHTSDADLCKEICDTLDENGASLTAVSADGNIPKGCCAETGEKIETTNGSNFDSLVIISDKKGNEKLMDSVNADHFMNQFFERKLPVSAYGSGSVLLGQLGLLEDREVSCDNSDKKRLEKFKARVTDDTMTTDAGLTTANSLMPPREFALKVAEEVCEGKHADQHA